MNLAEFLLIPELRVMRTVQLEQVYAKEFDDDFDVDRVIASDVFPPYGGVFSIAVEVPNVEHQNRLFCKVEIQPTSCLFTGDGNTRCSMIPAQLLSNCAGSLTLGISMLGGGSNSAESKELGLHAGLGSTSHTFRKTYSLSTLVKDTYTGKALQYQGFNLSGACVVGEIPYHTEVSRFIVACHYVGCIPALNLTWYEAGIVSLDEDAIVELVPGQRDRELKAQKARAYEAEHSGPVHANTAYLAWKRKDDYERSLTS